MSVVTTFIRARVLGCTCLPLTVKEAGRRPARKCTDPCAQVDYQFGIVCAEFRHNQARPPRRLRESCK